MVLFRESRAAGLSCVHPRPYKATTLRENANPDGLVDLVGRDFVPEGPNHLWFTDITYIRVWGGWAYLAVIIDGFSRNVGWAVDSHMRTSLVTDALRMAIDRESPAVGEVVIHSDRGSQYTSHVFRALALSNGIIPSVGHTGVCFDCETVLRHPSRSDPCFDWPIECLGVDLSAGSGGAESRRVRAGSDLIGA